MSNLLRAWLLIIASSPLLTACSLSQVAADQAGGIAAISSGYMRGFWDYEIARAGTASAIMQLEAMHSVSPQNEALSLALASAYIGHTFGFVELDMERASAEHQYAKATRLRARAELLYRRARDLSLATMRSRSTWSASTAARTTSRRCFGLHRLGARCWARPTRSIRPSTCR
jgi:hypothetical protein